MKSENIYFASDCFFPNLDQYEELRADGDRNEVITFLEEIDKTCPNDPTVYWRFALNYIELADTEYNDRGKRSKKEKKRNFQEALEWSKKAIQADTAQKVTHAYEMASMSFAGILSISGLKTKARLADSVRVYAEQAVHIDSDNDRAHHILGRWHYEIANLSPFLKRMSGFFFGVTPEGVIGVAERHFRDAILINDNVVNRYWLALTLIKQGMENEGLGHLKVLLNYEDTQHNDE
ncbi:MAG: hypothetical protein AAFW89_12185, partial [Bacteroidota bacterium]